MACFLMDIFVALILWRWASLWGLCYFAHG